MAMLTIARLTLVEAARRRLLLALGLLTLVVVVLTAWGFQRLTTLTDRNGEPLSPAEIQLIASQLLILVAFMFSGVLALGSVFVAAPSIAADVESGIALAILPRPLRRADVVLGKWLGLTALIVVYAVAAGTFELVAIRLAVGYSPPNPLEAVAYVTAESIVLMTLALLLSTRFAPMTGGVVALITFFMAWLGGVAGGIGVAFNNATIAAVGTVSRLLLPTDGLWRGAVFNLEPEAVLAIARAAGPRIAGSPFFALAPPTAAYLAWVGLWLAGLLAIGVWSFARREL